MSVDAAKSRQATAPEPPLGGGCEARGQSAFLLVDPARAAVIEADAAGLVLLGVPSGTALPVVLDSAMPAVRALRAIAAGSAAGESRREELLWWRSGQLVRVDAEITAQAMNGSRPFLRIRHHAPAEPVAREPALAASQSEASVSQGPAAPDDAGNASPSAAPSPMRDDRETLREIARRIREGHTRTVDATPASKAHFDAEIEVRPGEAEVRARPDTAAPSPHVLRVNEAAAPASTPMPPRSDALPADPRAMSKLAHELKTPLSAIVAAAEIMRDEQLGPMGNPRYLGYAGDIHDSARHALDVINAMLTGTAREARTIARVDLNELVLASVSAMMPLARANAVTLDADCDDGRIEVSGDATGIRQILFNLLSNALKFTPAGGDVRVLTGYLDDGTPYLVVRDTGEGMSEAEIMRAFYGEGRTNKRAGAGHGIGLPLVRNLAEMMGAAVDVDSAPMKGTAVLVSFPARDVMDPTPE